MSVIHAETPRILVCGGVANPDNACPALAQFHQRNICRRYGTGLPSEFTPRATSGTTRSDYPRRFVSRAGPGEFRAALKDTLRDRSPPDTFASSLLICLPLLSAGSGPVR